MSKTLSESIILSAGHFELKWKSPGWVPRRTGLKMCRMVTARAQKIGLCTLKQRVTAGEKEGSSSGFTFHPECAG